jgi:hypothetical protein
MAYRCRTRPELPPTASAVRGGGGTFRGGALHLLADPAVARDLIVSCGPGEDTKAVTPVEEASDGHVAATKKECESRLEGGG